MMGRIGELIKFELEARGRTRETVAGNEMMEVVAVSSLGGGWQSNGLPVVGGGRALPFHIYGSVHRSPPQKIVVVIDSLSGSPISSFHLLPRLDGLASAW